MAKPGKPDTPLDLGIYGRPVKRRYLAADIIAGVLSLLWIGAIIVFFVVNDGEGGPTFDPLTFVFTFLAIVLPIGMIWVAAAVAKTARVMREESARMQSAIDGMRHTYVVQQQTAGMAIKPSVEKQIEAIAESTRQTQTAIATFASRRDPATGIAPRTDKAALEKPGKADPGDQPALALDSPPTDFRQPISVAEFIRAVNFPEHENDKEGFRTLRRALEDRDIAKLVRAAQDVLTLLSQDGIYMDDLNPDRAQPLAWRRFAEGLRGQEIVALAGIRDRSCLALAGGRMKKDPVFRDAALHFLRQFDTVFTDFARNATDDEISEFEKTRTARAFMLLGRVAGTFEG